jgi:excisionase family DNA binding protein
MPNQFLAPTHFAIVRDNAGALAGPCPANRWRHAMKLSERELSRGARQRAMSVAEFCERYGPGRTKAYEELKSGRLRARKIGKRTVITEDDAEEWLRHLPVIEGGE